MNTLLRLISLLTSVMLCLLPPPTAAWAEPTPVVLHRYDDTNSALEGHATRMVQTPDGLLWLATWNGLYRFDGYEFCRLTAQAGDGCTMASDRLRDLWLLPDGDLCCRTDSGLYRFAMGDYRYRDIREADELAEAEAARHVQPSRSRIRDGAISLIDRQGLEWRLGDGALTCLSRADTVARPVALAAEAEARAMMRDADGRLWVATRSDASVTLIGPDGQTLGSLGADGRVTPGRRPFGHVAYCLRQLADGSIWVGCKPDGLFRLTPVAHGAEAPTAYRIEPVGGLAGSSVYDLATDARGRLWVATLGDGLACVEHPGAEHPVATLALPGYPATAGRRVRSLCIVGLGASAGAPGETPRPEASAGGTGASGRADASAAQASAPRPDAAGGGEVLLAATTEGLVVAALEADLGGMRFVRHTKDPLRPTSLASGATMSVVEACGGRIFVSTETSGVSEIVSPGALLADTLCFRHFATATGALPTDMTQALAEIDDRHLLVVGHTGLVVLDVDRATYDNLDHHYFGSLYRFGEARPVRLAEGWLLGTLTGAVVMPHRSMRRTAEAPPLLLTGITWHGKGVVGQRWLSVSRLDTLRLAPAERNLTLHFAALDYADPGAVSYQCRIGGEGAPWSHLGHDHSVTLLGLDPGTYRLDVRSTDASGQWGAGGRGLTLIVEPRFSETLWARLLAALALAALAAAAVGTWLYVRRVERRQRETLAKYLALLDERRAAARPAPEAADPAAPPAPPTPGPAEGAPPAPPATDPFMQRVLAFVEERMADSEADVGQMAEACAVSRSVLQRRLKQLLGVTPIDFLREARLKHACQILRATDLPVAEVAYQCGFNDPKYFSRCFKQSLGVSPSEYKNRAN